MATKRITASYLAFYLVAFVAILLCFYFIPSGWIETLTAQTTAWALTVFGYAVVWNQVNGYTTLTLFGQHSVTVSIIRECTALNVLGVMAGLILPLKASWVKRASGFVLSSLLLFTLNIPRIAITVYLTAFDTWPFTLIANRNLDTYHYPISFAFGVIGVAVTILAVSKWTTPELADTILSVVDKIFAIGKKEV